MDGEVPIDGGQISLEYNPRCLRRDLSSYTATHWLTIQNLLNQTLGAAATNIVTFQDELQGRFTDGFVGMHAAGHFTVGGDMGDFFSSTVDPMFFLHHAMLDRTWWLWQAFHPDQAFTVGGTITLLNNPPSRNTSVDDILFLGVNAPPAQIRDVLDTLGDTPLCYIYI
jgi:tyrosinase